MHYTHNLRTLPASTIIEINHIFCRSLVHTFFHREITIDYLITNENNNNKYEKNVNDKIVITIIITIKLLKNDNKMITKFKKITMWKHLN